MGARDRWQAQKMDYETAYGFKTEGDVICLFQEHG